MQNMASVKQYFVHMIKGLTNSTVGAVKKYSHAYIVSRDTTEYCMALSTAEYCLLMKLMI